jgi:hypothetical protein
MHRRIVLVLIAVDGRPSVERSHLVLGRSEAAVGRRAEELLIAEAQRIDPALADWTPGAADRFDGGPNLDALRYDGVGRCVLVEPPHVTRTD